MRKFLVGASAAAVLAVIAGCGSSNATDSGNGHVGAGTATTSAVAQPGNNADDIAFAQGMIPHHAQAVEMAKLVPSHSTDKKMLDLAARIQQAQDPEIKQLTDMLTRWGSAPASGMPGMDQSMPGMDMGGAGMMTADEMKQLTQAKGTEFDRMWTQMMIKHHEGAIEMARTEVGKGASTDAKAMAQKIIDTQQAEITEMRGMVK